MTKRSHRLSGCFLLAVCSRGCGRAERSLSEGAGNRPPSRLARHFPSSRPPPWKEYWQTGESVWGSSAGGTAIIQLCPTPSLADTWLSRRCKDWRALRSSCCDRHKSSKAVLDGQETRLAWALTPVCAVPCGVCGIKAQQRRCRGFYSQRVLHWQFVAGLRPLWAT